MSGREPSEASATSIRERVVVLALLYACLVTMLRTAEGVSLSLFLGHLGAEQLPYTFLAVSLVDIPLTFLYLWVARRSASRTTLAALALLLVVLLLAAQALGATHLGAGLFAAYLVATVLSTFIMIQWGVVILEFFTVEESLRAFPLVYTGAHAGGFVAGLLLRHLARPLGAETLILVVPLVACAAALALIVVAGRLAEGRAWRHCEEPGEAKASGASALRHLGVLRSSPLLRAIAASTAVMVCLRLALRYSYGVGFERAFTDPDELTRFIGSYTVVASLGGVVMQVLVTPALLRRLGAGLVNVIYAYLVGAAMMATALFPGLLSAVAGRATDLELKAAIKTPVSPMFYEAMGDGNRRTARALILGVVSPVSSFLSALALVAVSLGHVPVEAIVSGSAALVLTYLLLSHIQRRAFQRALEEMLVAWHRTQRGCEGDLDGAIEAALRSEDRRAKDIAQEVQRRRG